MITARLQVFRTDILLQAKVGLWLLPSAGKHRTLLQCYPDRRRLNGALSATEGAVEVKWTVKEEPDHHHLALQWRETGGPSVEPPKRRGFGTKLIERAIDQIPGASAKLHYKKEGVCCELKLPQDEAKAAASEFRPP